MKKSTVQGYFHMSVSCPSTSIQGFQLNHASLSRCSWTIPSARQSESSSLVTTNFHCAPKQESPEWQTDRFRGQMWPHRPGRPDQRGEALNGWKGSVPSSKSQLQLTWGERLRTGPRPISATSGIQRHDPPAPLILIRWIMRWRGN